MKTKEDYLNGELLLVDKPLGWTSFQAVNKLKWVLRQRFKLKKIKIGHAGTLDPLATGLLIICVGKFTKRIHEFQGQEKEYTGTITLGSTTPSYDLETEKNETFSTEHITEELVRATTHKFIGEIDQAPPIFSALKREGKRLYEYAREGKEIEIKTRKVAIKSFDITTVRFPHIEFKIVCSKGTYIRSIANDFGKALDSGAHLSELRRTKIGTYHVDKALDPLDFEQTMLKDINS